jgi:predicted ATP-grasp superfamily ATP-dependent carboligase
MLNILIVPSGTEIAHEIIRSLQDVKNITLFGANSVPSFSDLPQKNVKHGIPYIEEAGFITAIEETIIDYGITHVFPAHDSAAVKLSQYAESLSAKVISSSFETNEIARSKRKTYKKLSGIVNVPDFFEKNVTDLHFPLFAKPDIGQGSVGAKVIESQLEVEALGDNDLLCEFLPGDEFTVDCVTDSQGNLLYSQARLRCQMRNGIAIETQNVRDNEKFAAFASKINSTISFKGGWFFQVKKDINNELCLLEVSTRIAGSMITSRFNGINFAELSLLIAENIPVSVLDNKLDVKLYRNLSFQFQTSLAYQTIYTDFDDCLLLGNTINEDLIALLFNALNQQKKVVLITRHAGDLSKKLQELRITNIFDEIIHITNGEPKSKFIKDKNSIFIDDAFSERKEVSEILGIPCFAIDMIKGLTSIQN